VGTGRVLQTRDSDHQCSITTIKTEGGCIPRSFFIPSRDEWTIAQLNNLPPVFTARHPLRPADEPVPERLRVERALRALLEPVRRKHGSVGAEDVQRGRAARRCVQKRGAWRCVRRERGGRRRGG
jgi:hypothetical protein